MIYSFFSILILTSIFLLNISCKSQINPDKKGNTIHTPTTNDSILNDDAILKELIDTTIPKTINIDLKKQKELKFCPSIRKWEKTVLMWNIMKSVRHGQ